MTNEQPPRARRARSARRSIRHSSFVISNYPRRRRGFSIAELMIAVVILGIGLLITSSMFPIAWFKAREVAEETTLSALTSQAELAVKMLTRVNGLPPVSDPCSLAPVSSFFPGEFFFDCRQGDANLRGVLAAPYPDTRVHVLNLGNYGVGFVATEKPPLKPSDPGFVDVADNAWALDDSLESWFTNSLYTGWFQQNMRFHRAQAKAHVRLFPSLDALPDASLSSVTPEQVKLWQEQFDLRRYCWAVLYRFGDLQGPDGNDLSDVGSCRDNIASACAAAKLTTANSLGRFPKITLYYVTLKRPTGARYARQEGYIFSSGGGSWDAAKRLDHPRARTGAGVTQVMLPTPWRIEATLLNPPVHPSAKYPVSPTGIPSDIRVNDGVLADMLQEDTTLIDDRTGQVLRVAQRREAGGGAVVLTLDKEYTQRDIHTFDYVEFPPDAGDPATLGKSWENYWNWRYQGCDDDPTQAVCKPRPAGIGEDEPERRFYWVFPPPVESVDNSGVPVFDGTPPVVGIEMRQMVLRPEG